MTLREEYKQHKQIQESIVDHYSFEWLKDNVVVINEQIDRDTVQKLIDSIAKFDEKFGAFKDKIPAIAVMLNSAEDDLQNVITGRASDKKASQLLKKLTFLYRFFSTFFAKDLPILLKTPTFSVPKEFPSMRLDVLQAPAGKKYDPTYVRDAIKNALTPSRSEIKLLTKLYNGKIPVVNAMEIAQQMLALTFHDLEELAGIEKVPMAVTMDKSTPEAPAEEPMAAENVNHGNNLLLEKIDTQKAENISNVMNQILSQVDMNSPGLSDIKKSFDKLHNQAVSELASGKWDIPGRPSAMKQMLLFYNLLNDYRNQVDTISQLFANKEQLEPQDTANLKKLLQQAGQGGILSKLTNIFKTSPAQGLSAQDITNAIMKAVEQPGGLENIKAFFGATQKLPRVDKTGEPAVGQQTKPTAKTKPTAAAKKAQPTTRTKSPGDTAGTDPAATAADVVKKLKLKKDQEPVYQAFIQNLKKAGYKVTT